MMTNNLFYVSNICCISALLILSCEEETIEQTSDQTTCAIYIEQTVSDDIRICQSLSVDVANSDECDQHQSSNQLCDLQATTDCETVDSCDIEEALATCSHTLALDTDSYETMTYFYGSNESLCSLAENVCMSVFNGTSSCQAPSSSTGGATGGDTGGAGDVGGDPRGGDDQSGDDQTSGDQTSGDQMSGDQMSGDSMSGDQMSGGSTSGGQTSAGDLEMNQDQFDAVQNCLAAVSGFCKGISTCAGNIAQETFGRIEGRVIREALETMCPTVQAVPDVINFCTDLVNNDPDGLLVLYLKITNPESVDMCLSEGVSFVCAPPFLQVAWQTIKGIVQGEGTDEGVTWLKDSLTDIVRSCMGG